MHEREAILRLFRRSESPVLATVVSVEGSSYRRAGARMLLAPNNQSAGVINGGCLDADLHARAAIVRDSGRAQLATYDTTSAQDIVFGLGLGCRGVVKILLEPAKNLDWLAQNGTVEVRFEGENLGTRAVSDSISDPETSDAKSLLETLETPQQLLIFGAGADAAPLQLIARNVGWQAQVLDLRAPNPERTVFLEAVYLAPETLPAFEISRGAACVIMTHNFLHDLEILKRVLPSEAAYIGVLGPRQRTEELLEKLGRDTLLPAITPSAAQLARVFAPVGLDLGAETPEEIALSIVAEIQQVRRGKSGANLREKLSIH